MNIKEEYTKLIERRKAINYDIDYDTESVIKESIALLTNDVSATINYLDNDCSADQFIWISEIFDELVEVTQSKALLECFYRVATKCPEESAKYYIIDHIKMAEDFLKK